MTNTTTTHGTVGLFATCAVDLIRPSIAFACIKLLEAAGYEVVVPPQTCCGQVAYNNGLGEDSRQLASQLMLQFSTVDYVVVPSGSCASMIKNHYPEIFRKTDQASNALAFAQKVYELSCFLNEKAPLPAPPGHAASSPVKTVYHDSCAGLRELNIYDQPRNCLHHYCGLRTESPQSADACCGFGGTFCMKFPDIADKMVTEKAKFIAELKPELLLGGDLTCLLNIAGKLQRTGNHTIKIRHIAEVMAGMTDGPAIGEEK